MKILVSICKRELRKAGTVEWKAVKEEVERRKGLYLVFLL
jgi:hypothetical protein